MKIVDIYTDNSAEILEEIIKYNSSESVLVIFTNFDKNSIIYKSLKDFAIPMYSFEDFAEKILSKISKYFSYTKISDKSAITIINSISKTYLKKHSLLKNLSKSNVFARELYNLFGIFKTNKISESDLFFANSNCEIEEEDKKRFNIIIEIYVKYLEMLKMNKMLDFRDIILADILELENNSLMQNFIKKDFDKVYVFGAENLSEIQLNLLKLVTEDGDLTLIGDANAKIRSFMGASVFLPEKTSSTFDISTNTIFPLNKDIYERAIFIKNPLQQSPIFKKSQSVDYHLFSNFQDEVDFIAREIIAGVKGGKKYSDFAILLRDNSLIDNFVDTFKKYEIPVEGSIFSEEFDNFKIKFERILMICDILQKLSAKSIFELEQISVKSLVELEDYTEQFNLFIENFLFDILENKYDAEKMLSLKVHKKHRFLLTTVWEFSDILSKEDLNKLKSEFEILQKSYTLYLNEDFAEIPLLLTSVNNVEDENFHKIFAKFLKDLQELIALKTQILREKVEMTEILNLFQTNLSENLQSENKVNLLTMFKSSLKSFKEVFIPSLTENYFPKKYQSTYFISDFANQKISEKIRAKFSNFEKLIFSNEDELQAENNLMYLSMTRAEERVVLSSHKYSNCRQVLPSAYFEQFLFADGENFVSEKKENEREEIAQEKIVEQKNEEYIERTPVLKADAPIWLSASSINKFLKCPRNYYYTKLLGIKTISSFSANYGTAVHAIFELMVKKNINNFSKDNFLKLGNILFNVKNDRQMVIDEGFDEKKVVEELEKLSDLDILEMHSDFENAINNLEKICYFEEKPLEGACESYFEFNTEEIPSVNFSGYIDAIIKYADGWRLVDYKTSSDKPKLDYLFSENGVNFCSEAKGKYNKSNEKKYDYQIPLYFLACLNSAKLEQYKDNIGKVGYLYIRPQNSKKGESWQDFVSVSEIMQYRQKIVENIKNTVVDKIYEKTTFETEYNERSCRYCDFIEYCDGKNEESEE